MKRGVAKGHVLGERNTHYETCCNVMLCVQNSILGITYSDPPTCAVSHMPYPLPLQAAGCAEDLEDHQSYCQQRRLCSVHIKVGLVVFWWSTGGRSRTGIDPSFSLVVTFIVMQASSLGRKGYGHELWRFCQQVGCEGWRPRGLRAAVGLACVKPLNLHPNTV